VLLIGTSGRGIVVSAVMAVGLHKMQSISWLAEELLAS
jgi:hypothetical protein